MDKWPCGDCFNFYSVMLRDDVLIENNKYGYVTMQNNGAMKLVNFTHAQTAETRRSFRPSVNARYEATTCSCLRCSIATVKVLVVHWVLYIVVYQHGRHKTNVHGKWHYMKPLYCMYSSSRSVQVTTEEVGHFNHRILNSDHFTPHFALSMQCVGWTVLLIIHLQITCGQCGFITTSYCILW